MSRSRIWLASTALEDFWGEGSGERLFLSQGCLRYSRRHVWEKIPFTVVSDPWEEVHKRMDGFQWMEGIRENLLPLLAKGLNTIHETSHGLRYWRIMLTRWLYFYTEQFLDRFTLIESALREFPDLNTQVLAEECWVVSTCTEDYTRLVVDDPYNLQLVSQILKLKGFEFEQKRLEIPTCYRPGRSRLSWLKNFLRNAHHGLYRSVPGIGKMLLRNSYFPKEFDLWLGLKSFGRIWPSLAEYSNMPPQRAIDHGKRSALYSELQGKEGFEAILREMIASNIPQCFVESYEDVVRASQQIYPRQPRFLLSANSWYEDEAFKHFAGVSAENGTKLIGTQHGHFSGIVEMHAGEKFDFAITDRFYTWGWTSADKQHPMPCNKLIGRKPVRGIRQQCKRILFTSTIEPRHTINLLAPSRNFSLRRSWGERFFKRLGSEVRGKMVIRHHPYDYGWDTLELWNLFCGDIKLDTYRSYYRSMEASDLLVCNHLGTTFLEAIGLGKPCIKYFDPTCQIILPEARPYYDRMMEVGVIFESPEAAADGVTEAAQNPYVWWHEPKRKEVILDFRHRYARTDPRAGKLWYRELESVLETKVLT